MSKMNTESWFALHVYMNKVSECRDELSYLNSQMSLSQSQRSKIVPVEILGNPIGYYAPFVRIDHVNANGKRVVTEKPVIPSLFFIRSTMAQAVCFDAWMRGRTRLYRHVHEGKDEPIAIPLHQMQMFMMVSSGDQEGLDYFGADAFNWRKGERVRVIDGRFKGLEGEIKRINGNKRLVVAIEGVCAVATAYIPRCFLEKI